MSEGRVRDSLAPRLYRRMMALYPRHFRADFGEAMADAFEEFYHAARAEGGSAGAIQATWRAVFDLVFHAAREHMASWRSPPAIRRGAGRGWGSGVEMMRESALDLLRGARTLARRPALPALVVALIALGVGLNVALYSVVRTVLIQPLPFVDPERIVVVTGTFEGARDWYLGLPELRDIQERSAHLSEIGIFSDTFWPMTSSDEDGARSLSAGYADSRFFDLLGAAPALGRTFVPAEDDARDPRQVVILSHRFWQQEHDGDLGLVGQEIRLNGCSYRVIGVLGEDFHFAERDLWLPLSMEQTAWGFSGRENRWHFGIARLDESTSIAEAQAEADGVMVELELEMPDGQRARGLHLYSLREFYYGPVEQSVKLLFVGAVLVLLICCVNVGALLLVRAMARRREMALRAALGASRPRLLAGFVTESLALTTLGGALGVLIAHATLRWIVTTFHLGLPLFARFTLDRTVLGLSLVLVVLVGLVLGIYPALLEGLRSPAQAIRGGARRTGPGRRSARQRSLVVAFEVALAILLLVGSGLTAKSFLRLVRTDLGYDPRDLVGLHLDLRVPQLRGDEWWQSAQLRTELVRTVKERFEALPGVRWTGVWGPSNLGQAREHVHLTAHEADIFDGEFHRFGQKHSIWPGSLEALGIPLVAGREFNDADKLGSPGVVMIDRSLAKALFPDGSAVGQQLYHFGSNPPHSWTVVGVSENARHRGQGHDDSADGVDGDLYFPYLQASVPLVEILVRTEPEMVAGVVIPRLRQTLQEIDSEIAIAHHVTMDQRLHRSATIPRFAALLMSVYAAVAMTLAFVGTYGVLAFTVRRRWSEIAVRLALGAGRGRLLTRVLGQGLAPVLVGIAAGVLLARLATGPLEGVLFGVEPSDPAVYLAVSLLVILTSLIACYLPARRAAKVDPATVLRYE